MLVYAMQNLREKTVFILGEVNRDWSAMSRSLVRIFVALDKVGDRVVIANSRYLSQNCLLVRDFDPQAYST